MKKTQFAKEISTLRQNEWHPISSRAGQITAEEELCVLGTCLTIVEGCAKEVDIDVAHAILTKVKGVDVIVRIFKEEIATHFMQKLACCD